MTIQGGGDCPSDLLAEAVSAARTDTLAGVRQCDALLLDYPDDPRLCFLRGSLLAGLSRFGEARASMARAVDLAPGFALARFQLGLLELSSGDAVAAKATWRKLEDLASDNALRVFAEGLGHLIADRFDETNRLLKQGIALNKENPAINADMQLILDKLNEGDSNPHSGEPISAAHLLLQQYTDRTTKH